MEYSAAVSAKRRWAAVRDVDYFQGNILRVFSSAALGPWHESRLGDFGYFGVALAPLSDTTALLAAVVPGLSGGGIGLWRVGDALVEDTGIHAGGVASNRPRFRPRPSGGQWLAWGTYDPSVAVASFRAG